MSIFYLPIFRLPTFRSSDHLIIRPSGPPVFRPPREASDLTLRLFFLFPRAFAFAELAARELRYLWWLVLLLVFGLWLAFSFGKRKD
jgi:hypothetical protein